MKLTFRKKDGGDGDLLVAVAAEPEALVVTTRRDGSRTKRTVRTPKAKVPFGDIEQAAVNRRAQLLEEGYVEESSDTSDASYHYYLVIHPGEVDEVIALIREHAELLGTLPGVDVVNVQAGVLVQSRDGKERIRVTTEGSRTGLMAKASPVTVVGMWLVAHGHADASHDGDDGAESVESAQARRILRNLSSTSREICDVLEKLGIDSSRGLMGDWAKAGSVEAVLL